MANAARQTAVPIRRPCPFRIAQVAGPGAVQWYDPPELPATIGRDPGNSIRVPDAAVSKNHADIVATHDGICIRDLRSRNGITLNDDRVVQAELFAGDLIGLGNSLLMVVGRADRAAASRGGQPLFADATCALMGVNPPLSGKVYPLGREAITVGQDPSNAIQLASADLSEFHAQVANTSSGPRLIHIGLRGSSAVNGEPVETRLLQDDDLVQCGAAQFRFERITTHVPEAGRTAQMSVSATLRARSPTKVLRLPEDASPLALVCIQGKDEGQSWPVGPDTCTIGRSGKADITLAEAAASRLHAEVSRGPQGILLVDLESRNGTFVNEQKVRSIGLEVGDVVAIGEALLEVRQIGADE